MSFRHRKLARRLAAVGLHKVVRKGDQFDYFRIRGGLPRETLVTITRTAYDLGLCSEPDVTDAYWDYYRSWDGAQPQAHPDRISSVVFDQATRNEQVAAR